jgi:hypothetical protein
MPNPKFVTKGYRLALNVRTFLLFGPFVHQSLTSKSPMHVCGYRIPQSSTFSEKKGNSTSPVPNLVRLTLCSLTDYPFLVIKEALKKDCTQFVDLFL